MMRRLTAQIARLVLTVVTVVTLVFFMFQVVPGDQATQLAGSSATEAEIAEIRRDLGLDDPIGVQYIRYCRGLLRGDFGYSSTFQGNPGQHILERLPATFALLGASLFLTIVVGIPAGLLAGTYHRRLLDYGVSFAVAMLLAVPNFWIGLFLTSVLAVELGWLPSFGFMGVASLVMPAAALAARLIALVARMTRGVVIEEFGKEYVRTARAKGASESRVVTHHVLRNALLPTVTILGLQAGYLLGGSVVIERLFAWPGIGELMMNAIESRDFSLVQGITLIYVAGFLVMNQAVDFLYRVANPALRGAK